MRTVEKSGESGGRVGDGAKLPGPFAGYRVHDPRGERIGRVKAAFLNGQGRPEYLNVALGPLGLRTVLIPVMDVVVDDADRTLTLL